MKITHYDIVEREPDLKCAAEGTVKNMFQKSRPGVNTTVGMLKLFDPLDTRKIDSRASETLF